MKLPPATHHRLKHQAPGWHFEQADDHTDHAALAVTLPNGEVRISHPPRFGTDLDLPPYSYGGLLGQEAG